MEPAQFLDIDGNVVRPLPEFAKRRETLVELYRGMVFTRMFDTKAIALQRTGRLGTYPSSLGQEAVSVGVGAAMQADDILAPTYREQGAQLARGVTPYELLLYWGGDERGSDYGGPRRDFPVCITIGSHAPHAVGAALALKLRGEAAACVCVFGDGASSKGDVYEGMNIAGVWRVPVLFVVTNNRWAISVPREAQTAAGTLAEKASGCGFEGEQVDGNDVIAVRHAVGQALDLIRAGGGPHLIEAVTYRLTDHTTADDAARYRDDAEVSEHWKLEPIARLKSYLTAHEAWTREDEDGLIEACKSEIDEAAERYLATDPEPPETMFDHLYSALPDDLAPQREAAIRKGQQLG